MHAYLRLAEAVVSTSPYAARALVFKILPNAAGFLDEGRRAWICTKMAPNFASAAGMSDEATELLNVAKKRLCERMEARICKRVSSSSATAAAAQIGDDERTERLLRRWKTGDQEFELSLRLLRPFRKAAELRTRVTWSPG